MSKRPKAKKLDMKMVAFKIDPETEAALDRLVAKATLPTLKLLPGMLTPHGGLRSAILRQLIIDADKRGKK
jgi:hypothetical protein